MTVRAKPNGRPCGTSGGSRESEKARRATAIVVRVVIRRLRCVVSNLNFFERQRLRIMLRCAAEGAKSRILFAHHAFRYLQLFRSSVDHATGRSVWVHSSNAHLADNSCSCRQGSLVSRAGDPMSHPMVPCLIPHISQSCIRSFSSAAIGPDEVAGGLLRLLTEEERGLLAEQRELSKKAQDIASRVALVDRVQVRGYTDRFLEEILPETCDASTFSIVVAGEFNAGKSTVINALLGRKLLESGALPTTDSITVLVHGDSDDTQHNVGGRGGVDLHQVSSVPLLQDLTFVDTPGTNAVIADHSARTMKLLPTADLILFVTSADRPFPESERVLLQSIQAYRKSIVVVINKMDVLEVTGGSYGEEQKEQVVEFVTENASELLGARPIVIPVSARDALSAKLTHKNRLNESRMWERSNFVDLESFLKHTLTTETKIKSKLLNPIGVAEGMMTECVSVLEEQRKELETDVATLTLLQSQFDGWTKEMNSDMEDSRREIKELFLMEGQRCQILCDRMSYIDQYSWTIFDTDRFDSEWSSTRRGAKNGLESQILELVRETA